MDNKKPLIIVLSRNYSTGLGIIRSLGSAGYTVDLIASVKKSGSSVIASSSKYVRKSTEVFAENIQGDPGQGIVDVLMEYAEDNQSTDLLIFPADDFTTSIIDSNRELLSKHFLMPHVTGESALSITQLMDKTVQGQMAKESGLLTPEEWIIDLANCTIPEDVIYPCFVKPLQSVSGHKTEMAVCQNEYELEKHLLKMKDFYADRSVLVQEFLAIDKEYDLSGVCLDDEIIIPAIIEKTCIAQHERGVTLSGKMVPVDTLGELKDKIISMLKKFHYVGMFDMELNVCGDKIYFNEVNLRSGGPNYSYFLNGVNLPEIFVKSVMQDMSVPCRELNTYGKSFVYEKVAWEDYIYGYMTKRQLKQCLKTADYTLLENREDPAPGKIFNRRIRLSMIKNRLKLWLKGNSTAAEQIKTGESNIVVTGRNWCNILTMVRDFGENGQNSDVLRVFKSRPNRFNLLRKMAPESRSRYTEIYNECVAGNEPYRIVEALKKMAGNGGKKLLVPVDDYMVCVVDENYDELSEHYIIPNIKQSQGEIVRLMDKNEQKKRAAEYGLPVLHSSLICSENGSFSIPDDIVYPCFIKPNVSMKSNKGKMAKCDNRSQLESLLEKYAQQENFEMLAEEYADIKNEYSLLGLCTAAGSAAPGLFRVTAEGHKERKGVAVMGETVHCDKLGSLRDETVKFIESLGYTGMFDVDYIETADGKIYFIEVNFRAGASIRTFTECGVNIPGMFAEAMLKNEAVGEVCTTGENGRYFVSEKVLMEEFARGDASAANVRTFMNKADICFVKDKNDPQPYRYFRKYYSVAWGMRMLYKLRNSRKEK